MSVYDHLSGKVLLVGLEQALIRNLTPVHIFAATRAAGELGYSLTLDQVTISYSNFGAFGVEKFFKSALGRTEFEQGINLLHSSEIFSKVISYLRRLDISMPVLGNGALPFLEGAYRRLGAKRIACVSRVPRSLAEYLLEIAGVRKYFGAVIGCDSLPHGRRLTKNTPEIWVQALYELNQINNLLIVADIDHDAARFALSYPRVSTFISLSLQSDYMRQTNSATRYRSTVEGDWSRIEYCSIGY